MTEGNVSWEAGVEAEEGLGWGYRALRGWRGCKKTHGQRGRHNGPGARLPCGSGPGWAWGR